MRDDGISLFLPIYNGGRLLDRAVTACAEALQTRDRPYELVVVDDNSTDGTHARAEELAQATRARGGSFTYLRCDTGPSRRENLAASFRRARHATLGFLDADLACAPTAVCEALATLERVGADLVVGSRRIPGARVSRGAVRRGISFAYNTTLRVLFASRIHDHQCGMKVFRRDRVLPIIEAMGYDTALVRGWFWDAELLLRAQRAGLHIVEQAVAWQEGTVTTFALRRELRCIPVIVRFRIATWR